jgi:hypothetical protein
VILAQSFPVDPIDMLAFLPTCHAMLSLPRNPPTALATVHSDFAGKGRIMGKEIGTSYLPVRSNPPGLRPL